MKLQRIALSALAGALVASTPVTAQDASACWLRGDATVESTADRPSPLGVVGITMHGQTAQVCYGRPSANGREIMGGLVPFDTPWRLGANEATHLHLPFDAEVGGVALDAGVYTMMAVPTPDSWTFHFSTATERWGVPITQEVLAAVVGTSERPTATTDAMVETFTISYDSHGEMMGHLVFEWENTRVELPVHMAGMDHGDR